MDVQKTLEYRKGVTIPYVESLDADGYSYELRIRWSNRKLIIFICESGIHIEWEDTPGLSVSNIVPKRIFGNMPKLDKKHLRHLLQLLIDINFEGYLLDQKTVNKICRKWRESGSP